MLDYKTARTNMVESQIRPNRVTDRRVIAAFESLARERFVPKAKQAIAYIDEDLDIGNGRYMMEPMVLARLIDHAALQAEDVVLIIGAGTGYAAAILAQIAATVVALESDPALADMAERTLSREGVDNAVVVRGDMTAGAPRQGPFNMILFNGSVETVPAALSEQLADGGRMLGVRREGTIGRAFLHERFGDATGERILFDAGTPVLPGFEREHGFVF